MTWKTGWMVWMLGSGVLMAQIQLESLIDEAAPPNAPGMEPEAPASEDHGTEDLPEKDRLTFLNGDLLTGSLISIDQEEGLVWSHPFVTEPIRFGIAPLATLALKGPFPQDSLEEMSRIVLTNGDAYLGKVVRMEEGKLSLDTPYAGRMTLAASMIESIQPQASTVGIYSGPNRLDEWHRSREGENSGWAYQKGALIYKGRSGESIGRRFDDLPDRADLRIRLAWKGSLQLYLQLWAESVENSSENYTLMLQNSYVRCYRHSNEHGRLDLGNVSFKGLRARSETELRILMNRDRKEIYLFLDGEMVKKWTDTIDATPHGKALILRVNGESPLKIENMSIREWDGKLSEEEPTHAETMDLMTLHNGDTFSGSLKRIDQSVVYFATDFAELPVPMDRISQLDFALETRAEPRRRAEDVRLEFFSGERITLALSSWAAGAILADSETTGPVELRPNFISSLTFNPYDERHQQEEDSW